MIGDSGPYASVGMKVLERAAGHASGPYVTETIDIDAVAVRTNNSVCGAFGFGANQAQFAMEGMMDRLAEMAGISGWEIRSRNVVEPGVVWGPGQIMDDGCLGARACLDAVKPAWDAAVAAGNPVGMGLGLKNSGLGNGANEVSRSTVRFDPTARSRSDTAGPRWSGIHTVARQVAVEELGVEPDRIPRSSSTPVASSAPVRPPAVVARSWAPGRSPMPAETPWRAAEEGGRVRGCLCRRLDQLDQRRPREPGDPLDLRLRRPARRARPGDRRDRQGRGGPRRRPRGQSVALRRPDRGRRAYGARLRSPRASPATSTASLSTRRCAHSTSSARRTCRRPR